MTPEEQDLYDGIIARFGSPIAAALNMSEREMNNLNDNVFMAIMDQIKSPSKKQMCLKDGSYGRI